MAVLARLLSAIACISAAMLLHGHFCEWRTFEYAVDQAPEFEQRVLITFRQVLDPAGNAAHWDAERRRLIQYNAAWLDCYHQLHGKPAPDGVLSHCIQRQIDNLQADTPTIRAVSLIQCLSKSGTDADIGDRLASCLQKKGYREVPLPQWTRVAIGPRFDESYYTHTGWFVEQNLPTSWQRFGGFILGLLLPSALCLVAIFTTVRSCVPERLAMSKNTTQSAV